MHLKNCIDATLEMVERRAQTTFPFFRHRNWCAWTIPEIDLKMPLPICDKYHWSKNSSATEQAEPVFYNDLVCESIRITGKPNVNDQFKKIIKLFEKSWICMDSMSDSKIIRVYS